MSAKRETQKVVHGADVFGWDKVPRSELVALACMSPHNCNVPGCPGPENKRKLEAFDDLLAACKLALRFALGDHLSENEVGNHASQLAAAIALASPLTKEDEK